MNNQNINNKLETILEDKKREIEKSKELVSLGELRKKVFAKILAKNNIVRDFKGALENKRDMGLIAEIKKASPSLGDINVLIDIKEQAVIYEKSGANAISVLTDRHFKGELSFIKKIKEVTTIPILRKDFIFDEYQIYESYLAGADALLLIATVLDIKTLNNLVDLTHELGMECLVETHTREDMEKALKTKALILGVNARNLKTFAIDLDTISLIAKDVPRERIIVAESGIETYIDVIKMREAGATAILVGTTLMKSQDVSNTIRELKINLFPRIKICGITNKENARVIAELKPDYMGFIMNVPTSPRNVDMKTVVEIISEIKESTKDILFVGVFVDQKVEELKNIISVCGLDIVQLHGNETVDDIIELKKYAEVWKTVIIKTERDLENILTYQGIADKILLDAGSGSGNEIDLSLLENQKINVTIDIFAGGLSVNNIESLLEKINPEIVDANSKLELSPGIKDRELVREFIRKVRSKK